MVLSPAILMRGSNYDSSLDVGGYYMGFKLGRATDNSVQILRLSISV